MWRQDHSELCLNCGHDYGCHFGNDCPGNVKGQKFDGANSAAIVSLRSRLKTAETEVERLQTKLDAVPIEFERRIRALAAYAMHANSCVTWALAAAPCSCGLDEALGRRT